MPDNKEDKNRKNNDRVKPSKVQRTKKNAGSKKVATKRPQNMKKRGKEGKKEKFSKRHPKISFIIKFIFIMFLLLFVAGAGIVAGLFFGLFGDDFEITKDDLKIEASNSVVVDVNGNTIANLSGDEKRKIIKLEDMAEYLPKAYVAIEDERFYNHSGIDFKRTGGAILKTVTGSSSYGGSTITQQLVKNITKDDEASGIDGIIRKIKEWSKAYQVERMISKDQILELYLNILFVGSSNINGVELGSQYYFDKSAKDLDLAECAFMAGINNSPNAYKPFSEEQADKEKIKNKTLTVLAKMKELGYIENQEDYDTAVKKAEDGIVFTKGNASLGTNHSYHTDAVIEQVISQVMMEKDISRPLAENYVYSSGLTIYSTVDATIQARVEEETAKERYMLKGIAKNKENPGELLNPNGTQAAMVIIDHKTGNVLGVSGGLGEKTASGLNRATQTTRQPGSTIKPIADIAPAIQEKVITAATVYDDVLTDFNGYRPKNDGHNYRGLINMRQAIASSQNVPEIKLMKELTPKKSIEYLENMGVTSLVSYEDNPTKNDEGLALAIGGISNGISPLEMAAAYATIANDGEYITPTFYTKVVDVSGNIVLTPTQERRRVLSEQNAHIVKTIVQEPVKGGTAPYCAITGMTVAAKTGTTDSDNDRWLCGFTPYYTAACWYGYDQNETVRFSGNNPAGQIWSNVMRDIHKDLANASFIRPSGIVDATVCRVTGCLAATGCADTYVEMFTQDNLPVKCEGHGTQTICIDSNCIANEYCVNTKLNVIGAMPPKEKLNLWKPVNGSTSSNAAKITEVCTIHKKPEQPVVEPPKPQNNTTNNTTNTNTSGNNTTNTNTSGNNTTDDNTTNTNNVVTP